MAKNVNYIICAFCLLILAYSNIQRSGIIKEGNSEIEDSYTQMPVQKIDQETFFIDYSSTREKVKSIAIGYLGYREHGGLGRGEQIAIFKRACGIKEGNHWCACFTKEVYNQAGINTDGANAWSPTWFPKNKLTTNPKDADVFSTFSLSSNRINHVGIILSEYGNNIETIEGNVGRSRNGYGSVMKLIRSKSEIHSYANWID
jgi:hypothetical protein